MIQSIVGGTDENKVNQIPTCTAVEPLTQFTQTIQGDSVITVPTMTLVSDKVRTSTLLKPIELDFYLPGGVRLSEVKTYRIEELSPDGNLAVMVRLSSLKTVYNTDMFMLDKYSGHLFVTDEDGVYMRTQEKGWIFPTESTMEEPLAGNIPHPGSITPQSIQLNNFKKTPEAESTRDQIPTSTPSRTIREILDQKRGKSPQLKGSRESTPKPKTVAQLLAEKRAIVPVFSPKLELHLQMIAEQKELEKRAQQQAQLAQETEHERKIKEEQEQIREDEEEARLIQEEKERANRERMIVEGERLRLQAQQAVIERNKKIELERIEREKQERLEQHRKAEFAMKELEEKEKQAAELAKKVQEKEIETKVDSLVEQELQKLRSKVPSPEISTNQTNKQTKQDITTIMPKYPSTETLDKCDTRELNRRQRMYYQEKELILTEKLALAENAYFTRESLDMTLEQAQLNRLKYDNMKRDLEGKRKYCSQMLLLPDQEIPKYPMPPSVKTPSSELDEEQVNYYLDKSEELRQIETIRYHVYLTRLTQAVNEEEKEQCQLEGLAHEQHVNKLQEKVRVALDEAVRKSKSVPKASRGSKEPPGGDYLDLERTLSIPQVLEVTKQRLEELIKQTSETKNNLTAEQQVVDENIKQNLESMGMARHGAKEDTIEEKGQKGGKEVNPLALMTPQPQRERVTRTHVRPIGENSIPIRYSKELGRNGGIEQPTSTEARKSQNSALQTAKEFLNGNEYKNKRVGVETPVGEPQQELDWDGLQEPLREPHTQSKESGYQTTRSTKRTPELRTNISMQSKKRTFQKKRTKFEK